MSSFGLDYFTVHQMIALRRVSVPRDPKLRIYWVQHADTVAGMLRDRTPEVRMAACVALFHLDPSDLEYQAREGDPALRVTVNSWKVDEAAMAVARTHGTFYVNRRVRACE